MEELYFFLTIIIKLKYNYNFKKFWFSPEYAKLWIVFWFIMGILVSVISVFIVMKLSNSALARFIIDSKDNKGTGFTSAYFSAAAIACGLISIMLLTLGSFIPFTKGEPFSIIRFILI